MIVLNSIETIRKRDEWKRRKRRKGEGRGEEVKMSEKIAKPNNP
jgi:hypothetical protein